jgi:hypothetical protein
MLKAIVEATPLEGYLVRLRFNDGVEGVLYARVTGTSIPTCEIRAGSR